MKDALSVGGGTIVLTSVKRNWALRMDKAVIQKSTEINVIQQNQCHQYVIMGFISVFTPVRYIYLFL